MATNPAPLYAPYRAVNATNPIGYDNSKSPVKMAQNQRALIQGQGAAFINADQDLANQYAQQAQGTQDYLSPIEQNLASGGGGYNANEQSQIELSPQQKQDIVTGAGISAGAGTASAVGAADRATAAAGGNPAAMAAYRARAAQTQGAQAGDAMTTGRIAAQQAGSQGAQAVGGSRMGQQAQGLGYLGGLQAQQSGQSLSEQGLAQGAYNTQASAGNTATQNAIGASQLPTGLDKGLGMAAGIAGSFAKGGGLADGLASYLNDGGTDAVVAEAGPEAIIEKHPRYMDEGGSADGGDSSSAGMPWLKRTGNALQNYLKNSQQPQQPAQPPAQQWNKTTPYSQVGSAIGSVLANRPKPQRGSGDSGNPAGSGIDPALTGGDNSVAGDGSGVADYLGDAGGGIDEVEGAGEAMAADGAMTPRYRVRPRMMADGAPPMPGPIEQYGLPPGLQPYSQSDIADEEQYMKSRGEDEMRYRRHDPKDTRGWADYTHGNMQDAAETAMAMRRANAYRPTPGTVAVVRGVPPHMANGGMMIPQRTPIITRPTRVHLDPGDQVVPLSYRPKAKIRPSAALAAMAGGSRA